MKETDEIIKVVKDYLEETVPPALAAVTPVAPSPIDQFLDDISTNVDENQVCVYMGDGKYSDSSGLENIMIQVQLPSVITPLKHHAVIWKLLKAFDPSLVGAVTKSGEYLGWYPGEPGGAGGGSIIHYALNLSAEYDDCEIDY